MNTATQNQISFLKKLGYTIEDMGAEWGSKYAGQYRFMRYETEEWGVVQFSEQAAWDDLLQYRSVVAKDVTHQ